MRSWLEGFPQRTGWPTTLAKTQALTGRNGEPLAVAALFDALRDLAEPPKSPAPTPVQPLRQVA
jgi:hypothetical protein